MDIINNAETNRSDAEATEQRRQRVTPPIANKSERVPLRRAAKPGRMDGHTIKRYQLQDEAHRTVAHLRQILNHKAIPAEASVSFAEDALSLEWDE